MTVEEAKEYFGKNFVIPNLKFFNEDTTKFSKSPRISKAKLNRYYWYLYNIYQEDFVKQFGKEPKYVRGKVVFRRNGIAFIRFDGSKDKNFEVEFYDGSVGTQKLIPEVINKKDFPNYNHDLNFIFKDMNGIIKFE